MNKAKSIWLSKEDLEFSKRTEEAWQKYENGRFIGPLTIKEFKRIMKLWKK